MSTVVCKVLIILMYIIGLLGCWLILSSFITLPKRSYRKIIKSYTAAPKTSIEDSKVSSLDIMLDTFSQRFVKYIHMNDIKRSEMSKSLAISGNKKTPEEYMAYMLTFSGIVALVGLFFLIFSKIIGGSLLVFSIAAYIYLNRKLDANKKAAVAEFNLELPRYVAYLKQSFKTNTNVISVMEGYITDNKIFDREMNQAIADAKTSNFSSAMARLDQRVNSDQMKMVIHGLLSAFNGENVISYFTMLENDFTQFEISSLKKAIKAIPQKMQLPKILIFSSVFLTMFVPLAIQIVHSFKDIFG